MGRSPVNSVEEKPRIVRAFLHEEITIAETRAGRAYRRRPSRGGCVLNTKTNEGCRRCVRAPGVPRTCLALECSR